MDAPITPIQKLDTILYIISLSPEKNIEGIQAYLKDNYNCSISPFDIRKVVMRLDKDGYIEFFSGATCRIKFDGELFLSQGGYTAKSLADAADAEQQMLEIARLKSVDVSSDQNQKTLNKLTNRLSWATWFAFGAAFFLLGWQIYSYYHPAPIPVNVKVQTEKNR